MSASSLLNPNTGTLLVQFLPTDPTPHPYVENPFQSNVDGGGFTLSNISGLTIENENPGNTAGFNIQVDTLENQLTITNEVNGVPASSPIVVCNGDGTNLALNSKVVIVNDLVNSGTAVSGLVIQAETSTGNAGILLQNDNATIQGYQIVVGGQTADGISEDHLQVLAYSGQANPKEIIDALPDGSGITFGDGDIVTGCFVGVNGFGGVGRVYDTAYNKPITITTLQASTIGNITYDNTSTFAAGVYQIQLSSETNVPAVGTELFIGVTLPPVGTIVDFSGISLLAASASTTNICMNTGYFSVPAGSVRIVVNSTGAAWTGTWSLQLVKIG